jgi:hypothetical protein
VRTKPRFLSPQALGLAGAFPDGISAHDLTAATLDAALAAAPPAAAARYREHGLQMRAAEDARWPDMNAEAFFQGAELAFSAAADGVAAAAPLLVTPAPSKVAAGDAASGAVEVDAAYTARFLGNWCGPSGRPATRMSGWGAQPQGGTGHDFR